MENKILIVDDDVETLRLVGLMLQRQGFEIVAANNGAQALSQAIQEQPSLVLLDIMMPDVDGYQVTHQLRGDPQTAKIPILMFTAKSQLEDKVMGYEAGVDDYLTKPVHPVELVARIKALLARNRGAVIGTGSMQHGYLLGVMAPKGGMGTSSLVLNLAIRMAQKFKIDLIAAEMRPANGTWGTDLGIADPCGLDNLLRLKPAEITREKLEKEIVYSSYGARLLLSSNNLKNLSLLNAAAQFEIVLQQITTLASLGLLDFGTPMLPNLDRICALLQEVIVVTEPYPGSINRTRIFLDELAERGFGRARLMTLVLINRVRADVQLSMSQVQDRLGMPVQQVFPPAPELAFQAGMRSLPLVEVHPESLLTQQYDRLAEAIALRVKK